MDGRKRSTSSLQVSDGNVDREVSCLSFRGNDVIQYMTRMGQQGNIPIRGRMSWMYKNLLNLEWNRLLHAMVDDNNNSETVSQVKRNGF